MSARAGCAGGVLGPAALAANACRRTTSTRWTTVTQARDRQQREHDEEHDRRQAEADEAGGQQHRDQPVRALGDAHGRGHAEPLGAGAGVRDDLPEHEAGQRQARR